MRRILSILIALPVLVSNAPAQTTFATMTGIVTDPNGAVIPGAQVVATQTGTNYRYESRTNEAGYYTLGQLPRGDYALRVEASGFSAFVVKDIALGANDLRRIDARLELGTVSTAIEVQAGATLIETESARISDTKLANQLKDLPLNTRSLWTFLSTTPGVQQAVSGTATRRFSGSRNNQSDAAVDGITVSNGRDGTQITPLVSYIESFGEVRVDMANNSAEFGSLGQVTVVSKGGTNDLHGSGFDYYQTPGFRARDPFTGERSGDVQHRPGFSVGGPVYLPKLYNGKNRTFFFYSFETARGSKIRENLVAGVPLAPWRTGDFSSLLPGTVVKDLNGTPFPGNIIPATRINAVSKAVQDRFYPLPNYGDPNVFDSGNFRTTGVRDFDTSTYWTTRLDHRFSDKAFIFGRFTWSKAYGRAFQSNLPTIGQRWQVRENQGANVSFTYSVKPNMINELRWGVAYNDQPRHGPVEGLQQVKELGLQGLAPDLPDIAGMLVVNFSGLGIQKLTQERWRHPGFKNKFHQIQEQLSWNRGRHNVKMGAMLNRVYYADARQAEELFGSLTFGRTFTGFPYGDFLIGVPTTARRAFPAMLNQELRWNYDFFVADQFKVTPNLTLDIGLRYEYHPSARNTDGMNSLFDIGTGKIIVSNGMTGKVSSLLPRSYVDIAEASAVGLPDSLVRTDRNNFAPRIGVAWRPFGPDTVFRAGYGIYYDIVPETATTAGVPFVISEPAYTVPTANPDVILPRVFPAAGTAGPSTVSLPRAQNPNLVIPYSMQYNFTIEHMRGSNAFRLSYIGTNTRKGVYNYNINQPVAGPGFYFDKPRMFTRYPAINYYTNGAGHQYNGLTVEAKRRTASGLSYQFAYTLARDIGDVERGNSIENAYDRQRERGVWVDIPTHRVSSNVTWELPVGRGKKALSGARGVVNALVSGWSTSVIYAFNTGNFLTPYWSGPDPTGTAYTNRANTRPDVTIRPNALRDANLPSDQRSVSRWFDAGAFTAPGAYFGSASRGLIKGPVTNIWDAGIFKSFPIKERATIRWELTAVNLFNHPQYQDPGGQDCVDDPASSTCSLNISNSGAVGRIRAVSSAYGLDPTGMRSLRTALRIEW